MEMFLLALMMIMAILVLLTMMIIIHKIPPATMKILNKQIMALQLQMMTHVLLPFGMIGLNALPRVVLHQKVEPDTFQIKVMP
jgi:hypothetical protein